MPVKIQFWFLFGQSKATDKNGPEKRVYFQTYDTVQVFCLKTSIY